MVIYLVHHSPDLCNVLVCLVCFDALCYKINCLTLVNTGYVFQINTVTVVCNTQVSVKILHLQLTESEMYIV